jgi:hypothetical protein
MEIAHIAPTSVLCSGLLDPEPYQMAIASQVLVDPAYAAYYRNLESFVILDVPTFEANGNGTFSLDDLLKACRAIRPREIVLPDLWEKPAKDNIDLAWNAAGFLDEHVDLGIHYMAVPHAKSLVEYLDSTMQMLEIPGVETIGVAERVEKEILMTRQAVVRELLMYVPKHINIHLLGCLRGMTDLHDPILLHGARSMDTVKFVRYGLECLWVHIDNIPPYPGRGKDYFEMGFDELQLGFVQGNVGYWDAYVRGKL